MIASRPVRRPALVPLFLAALGLALLSSCPHSMGTTSGSLSIHLVAPGGQVLNQTSARTILPNFAGLVSRIEIDRYTPGATTATATSSFDNLASIVLADIDPGSWEFGARLFFAGSTTPFATGRSTQVTLAEGANNTVPISLTYDYGTGTGSCTLTVSWPQDDADALSWGLDAMDDNGTITGTMTSIQNIQIVSSTCSATIAVTNAPAGARHLVLAFSKGGVNAGVFSEAVNIFAGVAANSYINEGSAAAAISFGPGRLLDTNASLAGLALTDSSNTSIPLNPSFSSNTHEYTAPVANLSSFTFAPTRSIAGQKITYTWNDGDESGPVPSGQSQTCTITANSINTVVITVTAPNGTTTQTYTVRFVNNAEVGWELNPGYVYLGINAPNSVTQIRLPHGNQAASITLDATTGFTEYHWATNPGGFTTTETNQSYIFSTSGPGTWSVWCTATKDGLLYSSNTLVITVLPAATLTYNGNGHTGGTVPTWDGNTNGTVAAPGDMVKSGYQFVGWTRQVSTGYETRQPGVALPDEITNNTADVVLYANWQNVPPPPVTNVSIIPLSDSLKISWQDPDVGDLASISVGIEGDTSQVVMPGVEQVLLAGYDNAQEAKVVLTVTDRGGETSETTKSIPAGQLSGTFHIGAQISAETLNSTLLANPNGIFILEEDLTFTSGWTPLCHTDMGFNGTFDGNGHTITINASITTNRGGFFAYLGANGVIRNLHINITDTAPITNPDDNHYYGGIAAGNAGLIEFCSVSGTIRKHYRVGGIVGVNTGTVRYCYSTATIEGSNLYIGGLAGNNYGTIQDSYARGSVTGSGQTGGLLGRNQDNGVVTRCYSTGAVTCTGAEKGGLIGLSSNAGVTFTNSFYDSNTTGQNDTGKGIPTATANMKKQSTFAGWDFASVWGINTTINDGYPYLLGATTP